MEFKPLDIDYEIIRSGSKGNAVRIENMLVDCGVPFGVLGYEWLLENINYLFITHKHGDHLNVATLKRIKKELPFIKVFGNMEVADRVGWDMIDHLFGDFKHLEGLKTKEDIKYDLTTIPLVHDVLNHGMMMKFNDGNKLTTNVAYATDTNSLQNFPAYEVFDYMFLEANYSAEKLMKLAEIKDFGYDVIASAMRHLSAEKSKGFYYTRRRNKDSKYIELHQSSRFY